MVELALVEGQVRRGVSRFHPLGGVADVVVDEVVLPVEGEGRPVVNRHVQLASRPCRRKKKS